MNVWKLRNDWITSCECIIVRTLRLVVQQNKEQEYSETSLTHSLEGEGDNSRTHLCAHFLLPTPKVRLPDHQVRLQSEHHSATGLEVQHPTEDTVLVGLIWEKNDWTETISRFGNSLRPKWSRLSRLFISIWSKAINENVYDPKWSLCRYLGAEHDNSGW